MPRADLLRRIGSLDEAAKSYLRAVALVSNDRERGYLQRRLREVQRFWNGMQGFRHHARDFKLHME